MYIYISVLATYFIPLYFSLFPEFDNTNIVGTTIAFTNKRSLNYIIYLQQGGFKMGKDQKNQPASALSSPRFCNTGTFMRLPRLETLEGLDFAVIGVPFDTASSFRTGSRFGPSAIRNISALIKPNNVYLQVNVLENLKGADYGDVNVVPGYIDPTFENIENEVSQIIDAGIVPIVLGGDHSISLANLRAIAKKHGPVALVHFDSHADINDEVFGQKYNHGTPFRRAFEEGIIDPDHTIQVGMRGSLGGVL